jgi:radical SAM protein with 4Fe4S-binding SPASM domain
LRGVEGALKRLIYTVRNFKSYKEKLQSHLPSLEFTTVLNKHNFKKIPEIVEVASVLGVESINLEPLCINNKMAEKIKLNYKERKIFFEQVLPRAEELTCSLNIRNNFSQLKKVKFIEKAGKVKEEILNSVKPGLKDFLDLPCYEPWLWPKIEANGEVWPCSTIQMKTNIKDRSFKSIWYGSEFQKFRNQIMNKELPNGCKNCVLTHIPCNREIKKDLKNSDLFKFH